MKMALLAAMAIAAMLAAGCASVTRPDRTLEDLVAARRADDAARAAELARLREKFMARIEAKAAAAKGAAGTTPPTIDLLVISGGGDWGAFGAGVLKGWGRVRGEMARPQFDVVTGVSTGALIAPFAFLGDDRRSSASCSSTAIRTRTGGLAVAVLSAEQPVVLHPARPGARASRGAGPPYARAHRGAGGYRPECCW